MTKTRCPMSLSVKLNQIKPDYTSVITNSSAKTTDMASLSNAILTGNAEGTSLLASSGMGSLTKTVLGSGSGSSTLSDYAAIKNGSYGKLLKAYYKEKEAENETSKETSGEDQKTNEENSKEISSRSSADTIYTDDGKRAATLADSLSSIFNEKI